MKKDYKAHRITSTAIQDPNTRLFGAKVIIHQQVEDFETAHHLLDLEATFQTASEAESCGMLWAAEQVAYGNAMKDAKATSYGWIGALEERS
jgi:hypothetical protein